MKLRNMISGWGDWFEANHLDIIEAIKAIAGFGALIILTALIAAALVAGGAK